MAQWEGAAHWLMLASRFLGPEVPEVPSWVILTHIKRKYKGHPLR